MKNDHGDDEDDDNEDCLGCSNPDPHHLTGDQRLPCQATITVFGGVDHDALWELDRAGLSPPNHAFAFGHGDLAMVFRVSRERQLYGVLRRLLERNTAGGSEAVPLPVDNHRLRRCLDQPSPLPVSQPAIARESGISLCCCA